MEVSYDRTYGFSYLSEKTRNSNRLQPALSSKLLKDPECWSGRGLNPRLPVQQTGALPTELNRRLIYSYQASFLLVSAFYDVIAFGYTIFC